MVLVLVGLIGLGLGLGWGWGWVGIGVGGWLVLDHILLIIICPHIYYIHYIQQPSVLE